MVVRCGRGSFAQTSALSHSQLHRRSPCEGSAVFLRLLLGCQTLRGCSPLRVWLGVVGGGRRRRSGGCGGVAGDVCSFERSCQVLQHFAGFCWRHGATEECVDAPSQRRSNRHVRHPKLRRLAGSRTKGTHLRWQCLIATRLPPGEQKGNCRCPASLMEPTPQG